MTDLLGRRDAASAVARTLRRLSSATGKGWQGRMDAALKEWIAQRSG
ncbi:MAG: BrnA antitoxin family protein [Chromatiales bacterium]|nr:BrnA antitoxin family protein [Chromatiales bacterium]